MNTVEFFKRVSDHGFNSKLTPGVAIAIPNVFMVATLNCSTQVCHGLRWQLMGGPETPLFRNTTEWLEAVIQQNPDLKGGRNGKMLAWVTRAASE